MVSKKDYKLFLSLCLWALVPAVYLLVRMNIVAVNNVDINVLGQMEWFDLIDEIIVTTLTVPLYFLLKPDKTSKYRNGFAFLISFGIYLVFTLIVALHVGNIAAFMNAAYAEKYLFLQSFSMLISYISTFMVLLFTVNDDYKTVGILLIAKVVLLAIGDYILISKFADIGASYSEIIVNAGIALAAVLLAAKRQYIAIGKCEMSWLKDWGKLGLFAGIQIFLDNFFYAVMICRMVNAVSESGNYWVANNFIWGWLLVPVTCMAEIIKKNNLKKLTMKNTWRFAGIIMAFWVVTIPLWRWFISVPMASDADTILKIVYPVMPFYIPYLLSAFIDAWFISKGKTQYNAINSLLCNVVYYGILYLLFQKGVFQPSMLFIVMMFGVGMVFHLIVSVGMYMYETRKMKKREKLITN